MYAKFFQISFTNEIELEIFDSNFYQTVFERITKLHTKEDYE